MARKTPERDHNNMNRLVLVMCVGIVIGLAWVIYEIVQLLTAL